MRLRSKEKKPGFPSPQIFFLYLVKHLWQHEMNNESQLRLYTDLVVLIEKHYDEILNYNLLKYASKCGNAGDSCIASEPCSKISGELNSRPY
jgi:hypothetical protein